MSWLFTLAHFANIFVNLSESCLTLHIFHAKAKLVILSRKQYCTPAMQKNNIQRLPELSEILDYIQAHLDILFVSLTCYFTNLKNQNYWVLLFNSIRNQRKTEKTSSLGLWKFHSNEFGNQFEARLTEVLSNIFWSNIYSQYIQVQQHIGNKSSQVSYDSYQILKQNRRRSRYVNCCCNLSQIAQIFTLAKQLCLLLTRPHPSLQFRFYSNGEYLINS